MSSPQVPETPPKGGAIIELRYSFLLVVFSIQIAENKKKTISLCVVLSKGKMCDVAEILSVVYLLIFIIKFLRYPYFNILLFIPFGTSPPSKE